MLIRTRTAAFAILAMLGVAGCGDSGPKTYPVNGRIVLEGGETSPLTGHNIEASLNGEPTVRASGVIDDAGGFKLETLHAGAVLKGAREGTYTVRIVLSDDDKQKLRQARQAISPRYLKFETSGLSIQVPAAEDVKLELTRK
jgi:hypothetical protein